jgi:hypothetical protein
MLISEKALLTAERPGNCGFTHSWPTSMEMSQWYFRAATLFPASLAFRHLSRSSCSSTPLAQGQSAHLPAPSPMVRL